MTRLCALAILLLVVTAASATERDPSHDGPLAVGVTTRTFIDASRSRTLVTEIWYPATTSGRDAPPRRGRHPLVLVAHGHCGFRTNYEYLTVPLASWGLVVAAPDFPGLTRTDCDNGVPIGDPIGDPSRDLSFLRDALHDPAGPAAELARAVGGRRAGLVGHSLGGAAVVQAAIADARFTSVVALAPVASVADGQHLGALRPRRPVLVAGGSADPIANALDAPFFAALSPPAFLLNIVGGTHSGLTDMDPQLSPAALAREQMLVRRYATAFLERFLAHAGGFRPILTEADATAQGPDAQLTVHAR